MFGRVFLAAAPFLTLSVALEAPAPSTTRYRIESKTEQVVDLSKMGQGSQTNAFTQVAFITVSLKDTTGGQVVQAVIDSVSTDAPLPDPGSVQKAKGVWLRGRVDAWGRTTILSTSADSVDLVGQIKNSLARFFPVIKPGAKQGDAWVDTSRVDTKNAQQAIKTTTVTTYNHAGAATRDGQSVSRITAASATSGAGTMENPMAGTMEVEISDSGTETFFVAADGRYLGGESKSEGNSLVRTPMAPDPIPVKITRVSSVTIVK
ncbi:MAG: hypothetical protein SFV24_08615 [Gemmatimonadales bacterium]|nr:hypothetical protein [Gemmatimonadales bacterium]